MNAIKKKFSHDAILYFIKFNYEFESVIDCHTVNDTRCQIQRLYNDKINLEYTPYFALPNSNSYITTKFGFDTDGCPIGWINYGTLNTIKLCKQNLRDEPILN